jgi:hypothetical protein
MRDTLIVSTKTTLRGGRKLNTWKAALAFGLLAGGFGGSAIPVHAQGATFPDVPANHWAYQAVQDLADKGYVKGYPDGKFLGGRALTRYEFATVIDRMVQTIADLSTTVKAGQPVATPNGTAVTQDDLNKIQALVDGFKTQLDAIQSQIGPAQPGGVSLQDEIDALRADIQDIQANVTKAQTTANNSFGVGSDRKFQISGYVQARYQEAGKSQTNFPSGTSAKQGTYNGNYAQGGNNESFELRRARLKFTGAVTPNTKFAIQIDTSGAVTAGASANQQVTVREGYVAYTFGDGNAAKAPTVTAGLFANPFGYELPASTASILTPERPLAFSEAGYGIWANQDYDKGVQLSYNTPQQLIGILPGGLKLTAALVNGTGRSGEDNDRHIDQIYRAGYQTPDKQLGAGVSYYNGQVPEAAAATGVLYHNDKKQLFGADAQYTAPFGLFANVEYENGPYQQLYRFTTQTAASAIDAPGNRIEGYYGQIGYSFFSKTDKPLTFFLNYDKLRRATAGPLKSDAYDDENVGYGVSYNLDKATRLRVYYDHPDEVAHTPGFNPEKISQTTAEVQVKF